MQLHNLTDKNKRKKRVGRGGKRGTYSGRGGKGQTARAGHRIRPAIRDYLKQIPKRRGRHKHSFISPRTKPAVINVGALEKCFGNGDIVNPKTLAAKGLLMSFGSRLPKVKILGAGKLSRRLTVQGCTISTSARKAVENAGGKISS